MWADMASVDSKLIKYPESSDSHLSRDMPPEEKEQETDRWRNHLIPPLALLPLKL